MVVSSPPGGSGGGAVLAMLNVLDRDFQKPFLEAENGLVICDREDPGRARITDDLGRVVVDPAVGHPRFRLDASKPVGQRRDAPLAVLTDMLFTDPADGNNPARAVGQAAAEVTFGIIDPNRMMFLGSVNKET